MLLKKNSLKIAVHRRNMGFKIFANFYCFGNYSAPIKSVQSVFIGLIPILKTQWAFKKNSMKEEKIQGR